MADAVLSASPFARFIAILGRGPGRSRALSREEAREAFGMVLSGEADPHQVGAFLMLLRFRGEDVAEVTGMVEAARTAFELGRGDLGAALDWPSYGAGRTRGAPWCLLAALALARAGIAILMHGSNEFSSSVTVRQGRDALGLRPCAGFAAASVALRADRFAYLPVEAMAPGLGALLDMRRLFGLRSPVNTVARLLNPADAPAGVDGVFHPPYIAVHLGVAQCLRRERLLVLKGGGGEAEHIPLKRTTAHLWDASAGHSEVTLPAADSLPPPDRKDETPALLAAVWRGETAPPLPIATIQATIALGLLAVRRAETPEQASDQAHDIWAARH